MNLNSTINTIITKIGGLLYMKLNKIELSIAYDEDDMPEHEGYYDTIDRAKETLDNLSEAGEPLSKIEISVAFDDEEIPEHYGYYDDIDDAQEALDKLQTEIEE